MTCNDVTGGDDAMKIRIVEEIPVTDPRAGWAEAFEAMAREGDDALLDDEVVPTRWDEDEWRW